MKRLLRRAGGRNDFLKDLKRADTAFDPEEFKKWAAKVFIKVQAAWKNRDIGRVKEFLTADSFYGMTGELERQVREGRVSLIEGIKVKGVDIIGAWQEEGCDLMTVRITAEAKRRLTDPSGKTIPGGAKTPVAFLESWTFAREAWMGPWRLASIQRGWG